MINKAVHLQQIRDVLSKNSEIPTAKDLEVDLTIKKVLKFKTLEEYDNYIYSLKGAKILDAQFRVYEKDFN